ncbi:MAG: spore cortex biosynthesis protein YabQ [Bacillota bacterium]
MNPVQLQLKAFASMVAMGLFIGLTFDLYRAWRSIARPGRLTTTVGDFLVWLVLTPTVFTIMLISNGVDLRAYVFVGVFLGIGVYLRFLTRTMVVLWRRFLVVSGKAFRWLGKVMGWPFRLLAFLLRWPLGLCSLLLWHLWRGIKWITRPARVLMKKILRFSRRPPPPVGD